MKRIDPCTGRKRRLLFFLRCSARGFTLIELLVVLVIIGILAGYIGPRIMGRPDEARWTKASIQVEGLETALKLYKVDNGFYPSTDQGLEALIAQPTTGRVPAKWRAGGYLESNRVPLDPWGNPFFYLSPGQHGDFDLSSRGADGEIGGDGYDKDINSWELE
ncbi:MAG: type II secretion system major pseudopilin GspG [Desulfocapsaceae bacterium]